jgi:hypothetical protein
MMSRDRTTGLAIIFLLLMTAGFAHAQTANPARSGDNNFEARCEDLKSTCGTSFSDDHLEVICSYPPADWKGQSVYANVVVTYKCDYENQGGSRMVVCKGFLGLSADTRAAFTKDEFLDPQTRCTRLCRACPKGWK